jgi:hypothetical protein
MEIFSTYGGNPMEDKEKGKLREVRIIKIF